MPCVTASPSPALDIPTYSAGRHPAVLGRHHVPWEADVAVACAAVPVTPGDLLVGDADGVVVLPHDLVVEIVAAALEQEREDRFVTEQVLGGSSIVGLSPLDEHGRRRYEAWSEGQADRTSPAAWRRCSDRRCPDRGRSSHSAGCPPS